MRRPADVPGLGRRGGARSMTSSADVAVTIAPASVRRKPASLGACGKLAGEYTKFLLARVIALLPASGR